MRMMRVMRVMRIRKKRIPERLVLAASVLALGGAVFAQVRARPVAPPLEEVRFPAYQARTLDNGLRVFALEHDEQPVLAIQLVIGAGAANDPADLPGLASFTSGLLETGTSTRTAGEIAGAIDNSGGQLSVTPGREAITISASVLGDSRDLAFELIRDMVLEPAFAAEEIERLRAQSLSAIASNLQNPDFIADTVFSRALYGSHPYGHPADGTPASIRRITREDVVGFHRTWFAPETAVVAIAGAIAPEEAFGMAEAWFGTWPRKAPPASLPAMPEPPPANRVIIVDNPASVQTEIRIGQATVPRNAPDYFPVLLMSYVLGGPEGRLMDSLRSQKGLTYGAYESIVVRRGPGALYATTETRTETTFEAVRAIFDEIGRIRSEPVGDAELEEVKSYVIGSFPLTIEVPADLASRLTNLVLYDLGDDYLDTYRDKIAAIDADEVSRIAREHVREEGVVIVLVGRAEAFLDEAAALGPVEVVPIAELDLDSPALRAVPE